MKRSIPIPIVIVGLVLFGLAAGFVVYRGSSGPAEFQAPKTTKTIPKYIWDGMKPDMQSKMRDEGYSPADIKPSGQPSGAPNSAGK